jgi:periplasmic divalent cation tolerance protein
VGDELTAGNISKSLVESRLAACVNIIPNIRSIYTWNNQVEDSSELLLVIKTLKSHFEKVQTEILELHPYELPEIICLNPSEVFDKYLNWLESTVKESI